MKKIILLILALIVTGCVNINDSSYEKLIKEATLSKTKIYNTYRTGYKFYLPIGLYVTDTNDYNEIINSEKEKYYLYIDLINYLNKTKEEYTQEEDDIFFELIEEKDLSGYIRIKNSSKNKYLVEIAYNYAKIEMIVEKERAKLAVTNAIVILSSIKYNDTFLANLSSDSLLNYKEEEVDIFNKKGGSDSSTILEAIEEYDNYQNDLYDYDLIN